MGHPNDRLVGTRSGLTGHILAHLAQVPHRWQRPMSTRRARGDESCVVVVELESDVLCSLLRWDVVGNPQEGSSGQTDVKERSHNMRRIAVDSTIFIQINRGRLAYVRIGRACSTREDADDERSCSRLTSSERDEGLLAIGVVSLRRT